MKLEVFSTTPLSLGVALTFGSVLFASAFGRKGNSLSNLLFGAWLLCALYSYGVPAVLNSSLVDSVRWLIRSRFPVSLLGSAILYLYVLSMTEPGFRIRKAHLWHMVPFAIGLVWYFAPFMFFNDPAYWQPGQPLHLEAYLRSLVAVPVFAAYLIASFSRVREFRESLGPSISIEERGKYRWLQFFLGSLLIILAVGVMDVLTGPGFQGWRYALQSVALVLTAMVVFAIRQSPVFQPILATPNRVSEARPSPFSQGELEQYRIKLLSCMDDKKLYLDPQLRLADLAEELNLKVHETSELINRSLNMSFYDLVNSYRVEEAKRRLTDAQYSHMNVLGIATDCGFNSKSSFNEIFKRATGATPTAFRDKPRPAPA